MKDRYYSYKEEIFVSQSPMGKMTIGEVVEQLNQGYRPGVRFSANDIWQDPEKLGIHATSGFCIPRGYDQESMDQKAYSEGIKQITRIVAKAELPKKTVTVILAPHTRSLSPSPSEFAGVSLQGHFSYLFHNSNCPALIGKVGTPA